MSSWSNAFYTLRSALCRVCNNGFYNLHSQEHIHYLRYLGLLCLSAVCVTPHTVQHWTCLGVKPWTPRSLRVRDFVPSAFCQTMSSALANPLPDTFRSVCLSVLQCRVTCWTTAADFDFIGRLFGTLRSGGLTSLRVKASGVNCLQDDQMDKISNFLPI